MIRHGGMAVQVSRAEQSISIDMSLFEFDKTYMIPSTANAALRVTSRAC
jgi:hypothetical protein